MDERQQILNGMTNWQKSQYCRAKKRGEEMHYCDRCKKEWVSIS